MLCAVFFDTVVNWPIGGSCDLRSLSRGCDWSCEMRRNETRYHKILGREAHFFSLFVGEFCNFCCWKDWEKGAACCVRIEGRGSEDL